MHTAQAEDEAWALSGITVLKMTVFVQCLRREGIRARPQSINFHVPIDIACRCPWPDEELPAFPHSRGALPPPQSPLANQNDPSRLSEGRKELR